MEHFVAGQDLKLFRPYDIVQINDPSEKSAGIYFRISQKGVDYLSNLTQEGLPLIFHRMVHGKLTLLTGCLF